jgi:hypothetical protein
MVKFALLVDFLFVNFHSSSTIGRNKYLAYLVNPTKLTRFVNVTRGAIYHTRQ